MTAATFIEPVLNDFQREFLTEWGTDLQTSGASQTTSTLCRFSAGSPDYKSFCCLGRAAWILQEHHADWLRDNGFRIEYRRVHPFATDDDSMEMVIIDDHLTGELGPPINSDQVLPARLSALLGIGDVAHARSTQEGLATPGPLGLSQQEFYGANDDNDRTFFDIGHAIKLALRGDRDGARDELDYHDEFPATHWDEGDE